MTFGDMNLDKHEKDIIDMFHSYEVVIWEGNTMHTRRVEIAMWHLDS